MKRHLNELSPEEAEIHSRDIGRTNAKWAAASRKHNCAPESEKEAARLEVDLAWQEMIEVLDRYSAE